MRHLKIRPLTAERVTQAFPLIQVALPAVTQLPRRNDTPCEPGNGLAELLAARGHRVETLGLCKRLAA